MFTNTLDTRSEQVTMQQTHEAMLELIQPGVPNGKVAFWSACLSTRNRLDRNCVQASVMRGYANRPLPINRSELRAQLGPVLTRTLNSLYEIEKLWNAGVIHFNCGDSYETQQAWRLSMASVIPGMGLKTVSFALHIYAPFQCLLLTIDVWHERRLCSSYGPVKPTNYLRYESDLYRDIEHMSHNEPGYTPIEYAACLWERTRQAHGASQASEGYQSHAGLSCYC